MSRLTEDDRAQLAKLAVGGVRYASQHDAVLPLTLTEYTPHLQAPGASFVTLEQAGRLRGCIGALEATRPLALDVVHHAWAAARRDPRFPPVPPGIVEQLTITVSVLSPPQPLAVTDEDALCQQLQPGVDGVIITAQAGQATFLPQVWAQLPDPRQFVQQLKRKAGWPGHGWPPDACVATYTVDSIPAQG